MCLDSRFGGPYFSFLVVEKDSYFERRGRVQRVVGIKSELFHHPDALKIPDALVALYVTCFNEAHLLFNYHGDTVFENGQLDALDRCLNNWLLEFDKVDEVAAKNMLAGQLIEHSLKEGGLSTVPWSYIKSQIAISVKSILELVNKARVSQQVLLVLGV